MAGRYATALFELALEEKKLDAVKTDLDRFNALIEKNPDLERLVRSPVFSADEQGKALAAILKKVGIAGITANFLNVIAGNRRLFAVRDMISGFRKLLAAHKGEVTAEVTAAEKLSDTRRRCRTRWPGRGRRRPAAAWRRSAGRTGRGGR